MAIVLIDPGHGGNDPGALGFGYRESDRNLLMAQALADALQEGGVGVQLTRTSDETCSLVQRTQQENILKPDCFISCHMDAAGNADACGPSVWVHSKAGEEIFSWGEKVAKGIEDCGCVSNRSTSVHRGYTGDPNADYWVNRMTNSPSMLIEFGFITNQQNLQNHLAHYMDYAQAVAQATFSFLGIQPTFSSKWIVEVGQFDRLEDARKLAQNLGDNGYIARIREEN